MNTDIITLPERMIRLETQIEGVKSDVSAVNSSVIELKTIILQNSKDADSKYANKMTENIVNGAISIVLVTFFTAVVVFFIKRK